MSTCLFSAVSWEFSVNLCDLSQKYHLLFKPKGESGNRGPLPTMWTVLSALLSTAVTSCLAQVKIQACPFLQHLEAAVPELLADKAGSHRKQLWFYGVLEPQNAPHPPSCPQWCLDIRHYLRSSEQDLEKTILREKLCSSLLLISFLSCASAKKEIKLLPARSNVKPWPLQCQDCYLSFRSSARNLYMAFTSALTGEG